MEFPSRIQYQKFYVTIRFSKHNPQEVSLNRSYAPTDFCGSSFQVVHETPKQTCSLENSSKQSPSLSEIKKMSQLILKAIVENDTVSFARIVQEDAGILEQRIAKSLDTPLHLATKYGCNEIVSEIIRLCPSMVAAENKRGDTPFHEACRQGDDKILMMLLETDPWVASKLNIQGQSALFLACCHGNLKAASIILNQPWLQELDDEENPTFLHVAASRGHIAVVRKILETRPGIANKHDKNGYSPLHHACSMGHPEITAMLLKRYPEQAFQFNGRGYAPVHLAAVNGSSKVLKELLPIAPTSFMLPSTRGETVFHLTAKFDRYDAFLYLAQVLANRSLFYQQDKNGNTCLHLAVARGHHKIAEYIVKVGGEQINWQNLRGDTAMDTLEQSENISRRQHLRAILEAAGAKRKREISGSTENVNYPNTELSEEILVDEHIDISKLRTSSESRTESGNESSSNDELSQSPKNIPLANMEVANQEQRILRFGYQEISSRRKKISKRMRQRQHQHQSEKSRKNLIKLYKKQHKRHEIYRESLHNARETITLVAILIATITYTGGINPPGGVYQDGPLRGTAVAARRTAFKVFSLCNNIALFASLSIVIVLVSIIPFRRKPLMMMLMVAHKSMWVAVGFMATAYSAASVVLMPPSHGEKMDWTIVSLLSISAGTLGSVFLALGFMLMRHHLKKFRYRKKIADSTELGKIAKDADPEVDKISDGQHSAISDMDISMIVGYHTY